MSESYNSTKKKRRNGTPVIALIMIISGLFIWSLILPVRTDAAVTPGKPTFVKASCTYTKNCVCLKWKKAKGAKSYQIYRAKINPKTGKVGKYVKWASTKKLAIKKKASGDYRYKVRAVNGKKTGKWSATVRIFAASGQITNIGYQQPDTFLNVVLRQGRINMRVLVTNRTKSPMGFVVSGTRIPVQSHIYAIDKGSGKVLKVWNAYLSTSGIAQQVNPGKSQSLYFYSFVTASEWASYSNCKFMITNSFYPNPTVEPMKTQMALASTTSAAESAIAGK